MSEQNQFPGGQDMAEEAARRAEEARGRAQTTASKVAGEAHEVIGRANAQINPMQGQGGQVNERLNQSLRAASRQMGDLAKQLRQRAPAGQAAEVAHVAASALDQGAGYLQHADAQSIQDDLERLIRQNPLQALAVGVGLGFLLGRAFKR